MKNANIKTILVVDDSIVMRNIVKNTFSMLNIPCRYLEAEDGVRAYHLLQKNNINLILLDWNMPQMDGMEFLKKIRATKEYENLPVVMVTSESARYDIVEALQTGATDYIVKPISEKILLKKLHNIEL